LMSKDLRSGRRHADWLVCLGNELVVDDGTCSGEVSQLNDEVDADVEAVRRQPPVHDEPDDNIYRHSKYRDDDIPR